MSDWHSKLPRVAWRLDMKQQRVAGGWASSSSLKPESLCIIDFYSASWKPHHLLYRLSYCSRDPLLPFSKLHCNFSWALHKHLTFWGNEQPMLCKPKCINRVSKIKQPNPTPVQIYYLTWVYITLMQYSSGLQLKFPQVKALQSWAGPDQSFKWLHQDFTTSCTACLNCLEFPQSWSKYDLSFWFSKVFLFIN